LLQLAEYFAGKRRRFNVPLDLRATPFVQRVLQQLKTLQFGQRSTYGRLAQSIGSPRASRAVGLALSRNPIPIILPCHRILASDGGLGGFAGKARKLSVKQVLLDLES
jgi:methylated-DNA-[protein]-cysteine S-methyltransferase